MTLWQPQPFGVFVHDKGIAIAIAAAEQRYRVMRKAIIRFLKYHLLATVLPHSCIWLPVKGRNTALTV